MKTKTVPLILKFEVNFDEGEEIHFASLQEVSPKGVAHTYPPRLLGKLSDPVEATIDCCMCQDVSTREVCDGCWAEGYVGDVGPEAFIVEEAQVPLNREGVLTLKGYGSFDYYSGVDGCDWDTEFVLEEASWRDHQDSR